MEQAVHHGAAAGVGHQLAMVADEPPGRGMEEEALAAGAGRAHVLELGPPLGQLLNDGAGKCLVDVDDHLLDRLEPSRRSPRRCA